jgi:site-specific DNA-methyltransferase (adenine-specific)
MGSHIQSKKRVADHGEVFTSQREVNAMLDLVKQETENLDATFLNPPAAPATSCAKSPNASTPGWNPACPTNSNASTISHQATPRTGDHGMTALLARRSVYCSKAANGKYSVCDRFDDAQGNIRFGGG